MFERSLVRHLEAQTASIRLGIEEFGSHQEMAEGLIRKLPETKERQIHDRLQIQECNIDNASAASSSALELRSRPSAPELLSESSYTSEVSRAEIGVKFAQLKSSISGCSCSCHTRHWLKSPKILHWVFGSLVMGHNSLPFLTQRCDNLACQDRSAPSVAASYAFPRWFAHRIIFIRASNEVKRGPELLLRVWRVRPWASRIFGAVEWGRIDIIKRLFETGGASVFDVSEYGDSLLHVSSGAR